MYTSDLFFTINSKCADITLTYVFLLKKNIYFYQMNKALSDHPSLYLFPLSENHKSYLLLEIIILKIFCVLHKIEIVSRSNKFTTGKKKD